MNGELTWFFQGDLLQDAASPPGITDVIAAGLPGKPPDLESWAMAGTAY